jgi:protein gp37
LNSRNAGGAAGVTFFFKQWGRRYYKANGRTLRGREWSQMPTTHARDFLPV